jgi:NADH:ubiquinone oxidoreductase subunit 3 (subunit A)
MDFLKELLPVIFMCVVIPAIGVLTTFIVSFIQQKKEELQDKIDNDLASKYVGMLMDTICSAVVMTNQTYVNSLKKQGKFDAEAQKEAFNRTYEAVMNMLSEEAVKYLNEFYGDLQVAVTTLIEKEVAEAYNRVDPEAAEEDVVDEYDIEEADLSKEQIIAALNAYKEHLDKGE